MTTVAPTKSAAKKAPAKLTPPPGFSLADVTPEEAPVPTRVVSSVAAKDNPTLEWLRKSWANKGAPTTSGITYGKGQRIPIPNSEEVYKQVAHLLRTGARTLGKEIGVSLGVSITTWDKVQPVDGTNGTRVYVAFAAKTAKTVVRKPKQNK